MAQFTTDISVSFAALEQMGFKLLGELVAQMMGKVLKVMDDAFFEQRDRARYESNGPRPRSIQTLFGEFQYSRRVYRDRLTGELVALLDEALGLESRARMSPGLVQTAVIKAAEGPSYRGARDIVSGFYGHQVISHESIRQKVLLAGQRIAQEERRALRDPRGDRKVGVLFVEVDGVYVARQGCQGKRRELRLMVAHEGWRPRHPASDEYELIKPMRFSVDGGKTDFWEAASRALYTRYDLTDTLVVINGDRASWIRQGVEYFPRAIYQFDRFHLLRDMKQALRDHPEDCLAAIKAIRADRPAKAFWILRKIARQPGDREEARRLLADLKGNGRAMIDYRVRIRAMGYDVRGYRGLGVAESNVSLYSKRLRHRGQSWGNGFMAMVRLLTRHLEGFLLNYTTDLTARDLVSESDLRKGLGRVTMEVANSALIRFKGHVPVLNMGRNASNGLSHFFRQVNQTLPAGLS